MEILSKHSLLFFFMILCSCILYAQDRSELEKERQKTQDELEFTNNLLKTTIERKQKSVEDYIITNKKIELRLRNIQQLKSEILKIESNINEEQGVISSLKTDLDKLRAEYAQLIYQSYKTKQMNDKIMYVMASADFNQAYRRIKYLHQYSRYRKSQILSIEATQTVLEKRVFSYEELKTDKQQLLNEVNSESLLLNSEKIQQEKTLKELTSKEKQLKEEIEKKQKLAEELKKRIEKLIAEEIERSKKGSKNYQLTPEEKLTDDQFSSNLRRLPWPLERGIITESFGEHNHPVLTGIKIRNDGIDITTGKSSPVRSVFNGIVRNVFVIPGMNKVVIIRHGSYLTVYSNLIDVYVKLGETVKTKQLIGVLASDSKSDVSILKFQIWKENEKLDPEKWLAGAK